MILKKYTLADIAIFNKRSLKKSDCISHIEYLDTSSITENFISGTTLMSVEEAPSRAQRRVGKSGRADDLRNIRRRRKRFRNGKRICKAGTGANY